MSVNGVNSSGSVAAVTAQAVTAQTTSLTVPVSHYEKPAKFTGKDFKTWQSKMHFYLTTLKLARFLKEDPPTSVVGEGADLAQVQTAVDNWKESDFLCRNLVLNGLSDELYKVYQVKKTAKELWESLDHKYRMEDAGAKKYLVAKFLNFTMVDSKSVVNQVHDFQLIIHEILAEGMVISESFQVGAIIEKLPPGWKDFKNYLKHKKKEMTVEDLIVRLQIEEDNRSAGKKSTKMLVLLRLIWWRQKRTPRKENKFTTRI